VDPELRRRRQRQLSKFKFTRLSKLPSRLKGLKRREREREGLEYFCVFVVCWLCVTLLPKNERRKVVLYLECMSVNGLERESRERESESSWPISTR